MEIIPAIDLINGKPVRLVQGEFDSASQVAEDAVAQAKIFEEQGARLIHLVDLDGSKAGHPVNDKTIFKIAEAVSIPVEIGGGIRTMEDISHYLDHGVERVILASRVLENPEFLKEAFEKYGNRVVLGIDCRNGMVASNGWLDTSGVHYLDLLSQLNPDPSVEIIFTDIATDGMLSGPNLKELSNLLSHVKNPVIASGGISSLKDLENLKNANVHGAIVGKAIYNGNVDLKEAIVHAG